MKGDIDVWNEKNNSFIFYDGTFCFLQQQEELTEHSKRGVIWLLHSDQFTIPQEF